VYVKYIGIYALSVTECEAGPETTGTSRFLFRLRKRKRKKAPGLFPLDWILSQGTNEFEGNAQEGKSWLSSHTGHGLQPVQENSCVTQLGDPGDRARPESLPAQRFWEPLESPAIVELSEDGSFAPSLTH
jgi:hypothetical protein